MKHSTLCWVDVNKAQRHRYVNYRDAIAEKSARAIRAAATAVYVRPAGGNRARAPAPAAWRGPGAPKQPPHPPSCPADSRAGCRRAIAPAVGIGCTVNSCMTSDAVSSLCKISNDNSQDAIRPLVKRPRTCMMLCTRLMVVRAVLSHLCSVAMSIIACTHRHVIAVQAGAG